MSEFLQLDDDADGGGRASEIELVKAKINKTEEHIEVLRVQMSSSDAAHKITWANLIAESTKHLTILFEQQSRLSSTPTQGF